HPSFRQSDQPFDGVVLPDRGAGREVGGTIFRHRIPGWWRPWYRKKRVAESTPCSVQRTAAASNHGSEARSSRPRSAARGSTGRSSAEPIRLAVRAAWLARFGIGHRVTPSTWYASAAEYTGRDSSMQPPSSTERSSHTAPGLPWNAESSFGGGPPSM